MTTHPQPTDLGDGLRKLAAMVDANPEVGQLISWSLLHIHEPLDSRDEVAKVIRAALRAGAKVDKKLSGEYARFECSFGEVALELSVARDQVCERVIVGTDTVTEHVPDPAIVATVPLVSVVKTVDRYEWRCTSVLAELPELEAVGA